MPSAARRVPTPREDLAEFAVSLAAVNGLQCRPRRGPLGYYRLVTITRRPAYTQVDEHDRAS